MRRPSAPSPSDCYIYVFVRQDLPLEHQLVQSNHATWSMGAKYGDESTPNMVLIGVADICALEAVSELLAANQIPQWIWHEPDFNFGFTSIATAPIRGAQRQCLAHFRTWKSQVFTRSSVAEQEALKPSVAGSSPAA